MSAHTETEPSPARSRLGVQKLVADIGAELGNLLQSTLRLFVRESQSKVSFIVTNVVKITIAIGVTLMGVGYLLASINAFCISLLVPQVMGLNEARWVVPLVIGLLTAIVGYILYRHGMRRVLNVDIKPNRTAESLEEDRDWIRDKTKGNA